MNKSCVVHPAIKLWISRVSAVEPHLHKQPLNWYETYPKVLKGSALRFLAYHRDYDKKPHRLSCMRVFAQLACEVFCCKIGIKTAANAKDVVWFYPLETADYYLKLDIPMVVLEYLEKGRFRLCTAETDSLLFSSKDTFELRLIKEVEEDNMLNLSFVLRRYTVENLQNAKQEHKNEQIGTFSSITNDVHIILYSPSAAAEEHIYQIYTGDSSKTFYTIPKGKSLFAFLLHNDSQTYELACQTNECDNYLYFRLKHGLHMGIVVVCAQSDQEAKEQLMKNTKYKTFFLS
ncbi:MAG: hypothetical protein K2Q45_02380 [Nitrosomonas sp.]|nr:hypothetical protein [Nitrosomonas sp.]